MLYEQSHGNQGSYICFLIPMRVCLWEFRTLFDIRDKIHSLNFTSESLFGKLCRRHRAVIMPKYSINLTFFPTYSLHIETSRTKKRVFGLFFFLSTQSVLLQINNFHDKLKAFILLCTYQAFTLFAHFV